MLSCNVYCCRQLIQAMTPFTLIFLFIKRKRTHFFANSTENYNYAFQLFHFTIEIREIQLPITVVYQLEYKLNVY